MPAPLHKDAVAYLEQKGMPVTTQALNKTMNLLNEQPNLRPSYAGETGALDVDVETMKPIRSTGPLPPLDTTSNANLPFNKAFAQARKQGLSEFEWNGKRYNTKLKEEMQSGAVDTPNVTKGLKKGQVNPEAEAEMQSSLQTEKDQTQESDMTDLLAAIGIGGAGAAGAYALNRRPRGGYSQSQQMVEGDLTPPKPKKGQMVAEDLYGKRPQAMTDEDLFTRNSVNNMMTDEDLYGRAQTDEDFLRSVIDDADNYLPEERAAAQAALRGNRQQIQGILRKLPKGVDKKLLTILKAF